MKLSNLLIKFFAAVSSLIEISANLYHTVRDFIVSTVKEIKGHFGKSSNDHNG